MKTVRILEKKEYVSLLTPSKNQFSHTSRGSEACGQACGVGECLAWVPHRSSPQWEQLSEDLETGLEYRRNPHRLPTGNYYTLRLEGLNKEPGWHITLSVLKCNFLFPFCYKTLYTNRNIPRPMDLFSGLISHKYLHTSPSRPIFLSCFIENFRILSSLICVLQRWDSVGGTVSVQFRTAMEALGSFWLSLLISLGCRRTLLVRRCDIVTTPTL